MLVKIVFTYKNCDLDKRNAFHVKNFIRDALADKINNNEYRVDENRIIIKKKKWVDISYRVVEFDNLIFLELVTSTANADDFKSFETIWNCITKTSLRKDVYIHKVFDEPSHTLCVRLYKSLALFERNLRRLIYEIVAKVYGGAWFRKTIDELVKEYPKFDELSITIKSKAKGDKADPIDVALEEMTYENVITYLFEPTKLKSYEYVMEKDFSDENLEVLTKEDIKSIIQSNRPQSLWERLFSEYKELNDLQNDIHDIQKLRNKVMHAKSITYPEYMSLNRLLKKWNPLIEEACLKNETKKYEVGLNVNAINSLANSAEIMKSMVSVIKDNLSIINADAFKDMAKTLANSMRSIIDAYSNIDYSSLLAPMLAFSDFLPPMTDLPLETEGEEKDSNIDGDDGTDKDNHLGDSFIDE